MRLADGGPDRKEARRGAEAIFAKGFEVLRTIPASSLAALAVALACPAAAQQAPAAAQSAAAEQAPDVVDQAAEDVNQIVVIAGSLRGQVEGPEPPIVELNEEDIAAYGAGSLAELVAALATETGSGRGRGGGQPLFLINGLRVSSFREMRSYPPEAIRKVEVLPEEVAQRYGFPPNQRVINFILKESFSSREIEGEYGQPFDGGTSTRQVEATLLQIAGPSRLNFNVELGDTSMLTEAERGVIQSVVPTVPGDPDPAAYRSLVADSGSYELTGNWTRAIGGGGASLSLNGTAQRNDSRSLSGLDTVLLVAPGGDSVVRIFGADDPLTRRSRTDTFSLGTTLNARAGGWQLTGTLDANHAISKSWIDRRADTSALVAAAAAGTLALDDPIAGVAEAGFDKARTKSDGASAKFTAMGHPVLLPAGELSLTLDGGYDWDRINSDDTRNPGEDTRLTRGDINGGINLSAPIASRNEDVLAFLGNVTVNLSAGANHLSDFGTLTDWSAGFNWAPTEKLNFQASYIFREAAPGLSQLGAPTVVNYNVPVYDFTNGQTVLASITTGGNPALSRETQRDIKLGVSYQLPLFERSNVSVEYFTNRSSDVTASFPVLTPAIEAAFPGRVTRDAGGNLVAIDQRPVTFSKQKSRRIRIGLNISGNIGSRPEGQGGGGGGGFVGGFAGPGGPGGFGGPGGQGGPGGPGGQAGQGGQGGPPPGGGFFFFGGGQGGQGGNFNPQAFAEFRQRLCVPAPEGADAPATPDISGLPEQMQERLKGPDGNVDPERIAELKQRMCSGDGAPFGGGPGQGGAGLFNAERFGAIRKSFCEDGATPDLSLLPEPLAERLKGPDGQIDQVRLTDFKQRICSIDPAQIAAFQARQAQQGQGGAPATPGAQQPQGGPPPAAQATQGGQRGPAGAAGFFPGGGGRSGNFGRWNLSLSHTIELENEVLVAPGGPLLDLLHGDALTGGGVSRHTLSLEGGVFYNGFGMRFSGNYRSSTRVDGSGLPGSSDLLFGDLFTINLRMFADLGRQEKLVEDAPFLKNSRVSFSIDNLFDTRQKVTDQNGIVPLRYQPYLIDPTGRTFSIEFRKMF